MTAHSLHQSILPFFSQGKWVDAHPLVVQLIQITVSKHDKESVHFHAEGYFLLGILNAELGQFNKATQCIIQANKIYAKDEYHAYLAKCWALLGDTNAAMRSVDSIALSRLNEPNALDTVGVALSRIGFHDAALPFFEKAIELKSSIFQYFYNYGMSLKFAGKFSQAKAAYERALELNPKHAPTHFALSDLGQINDSEHHIKRLTTLLDDESVGVDDRMHYAHALALELQALGRHPEAFNVLVQAKAKKAISIEYDIARDQALFASIKKTFCEQVTHNIQASTCTSNRPIFIVGMPRSGTTLVERILSHHSQVGSGGELQDFGIAVKQLTKTSGQTVLDIPTLTASASLDMTQLGQLYLDKTQRIAPDNQRFIDKLPFNFFYIPLIQRALPNAKIIVMLRDPMDTCIGNFRQLFSLNSPYYHYAFNLDTVGEFYAQFRQHIDHCFSINPDNIRLQQYETLAQFPETEVQSLLAFCELDYEAQCVDVQNNTLPVSTASKMQVRQPINTSSIGRWKKFGEATQPLQDILHRYGLM